MSQTKSSVYSILIISFGLILQGCTPFTSKIPPPTHFCKWLRPHVAKYGVTSDLDGKSRSVGGVCDLGPYEK